MRACCEGTGGGGRIGRDCNRNCCCCCSCSARCIEAFDELSRVSMLGGNCVGDVLKGGESGDIWPPALVADPAPSLPPLPESTSSMILRMSGAMAELLGMSDVDSERLLYPFPLQARKPPLLRVSEMVTIFLLASLVLLFKLRLLLPLVFLLFPVVPSLPAVASSLSLSLVSLKELSLLLTTRFL